MLIYSATKFLVAVLSIRMTFTGRSFNELAYYVKKVEGVRRDSQVMALEKSYTNSGICKDLIPEV